MRSLAALAIVLALAWFAAVVFLKVTSFAVHLLLVAAVVLLVAAVVRKSGGGRPTRAT